MSIFYDPKKRKAKLWIKIFFILIPIFVVVGFFFFGQYRLKKKATQDLLEKQKELDVFQKFNGGGLK